MDTLILRLEAPLMSFGAPIVDRHGVIQPYPALSMMAGMLGNALGYDHADSQKLQRLQERLQYAVRQDRAGQKVRDYQTVDLSQDFMSDDNAWTSQGWLDKRKGGSASTGTHIRLRDYWADAIYTVALTLQSQDESPTLERLAEALQEPERPLFIGRKTCLPSTPLLIRQLEADNLVQALQNVKPAQKAEKKESYQAWWPVRDAHGHPDSDMEQPVTDRRDWANQIHVGERWIARGGIQIKTQEANHE